MKQSHIKSVEAQCLSVSQVAVNKTLQISIQGATWRLMSNSLVKIVKRIRNNAIAKLAHDST